MSALEPQPQPLLSSGRGNIGLVHYKDSKSFFIVISSLHLDEDEIKCVTEV